MIGAPSMASMPTGTPTIRPMRRSKPIRPRSPEQTGQGPGQGIIRGEDFLARRGFHERNERRERPMYYQAIMQCTQAVKNVEAWPDKAVEQAAAKHFDLGVV